MIENNLKFLRAYFRGIPKRDIISSKSVESTPNGNLPAHFPEMVQEARRNGSVARGVRGWQIFWDGSRLKLDYLGASDESGFSGAAEFREEESSGQLHFSFALSNEDRMASHLPGTLHLEFSVRFSGRASGGGDYAPASPAAAVESPRALAEELLASLSGAAAPDTPTMVELEGPRLLDNPDFENTLTVLQGIIDHLRSSVEANRPRMSPGPLLPDQPDWPVIPPVDFRQNRDHIEHLSLKIHALTGRTGPAAE